MPRVSEELVFDEDSHVVVMLKIPAPLYRLLHRYCVYRKADDGMIPKAATAAIRAYFGTNAAFQAWLREHPDDAAPLPTAPVRPSQRRRPARAERVSPAT